MTVQRLSQWVVAALWIGGCVAEVGVDDDGKGRFYGGSNRDLSGVWVGQNDEGQCHAFIESTTAPNEYSLELNCMRQSRQNELRGEGWSARSGLTLRAASAEGTSSDEVGNDFQVYRGGTRLFDATYQSNGLIGWDYMELTGLGVSWASTIRLQKQNSANAFKVRAAQLLAGADPNGKRYRVEEKEAGTIDAPQTLAACSLTVRRSRYGLSLIDMHSDCDLFPGPVEGAVGLRDGDRIVYDEIGTDDSLVRLRTDNSFDSSAGQFQQAVRLMYAGRFSRAATPE